MPNPSRAPTSMERIPILDPAYEHLSSNNIPDQSDIDAEDEASFQFDDEPFESHFRVKKYWYRGVGALLLVAIVGTACWKFAFPSGNEPESAIESQGENQKLYDAYLCNSYDG